MKNIRETTTRRAGGLIVLSGGAKLEVRGERAPSARETGAPGFAGTAIEIDFRPGIDVEVEGEDVF